MSETNLREIVAKIAKLVRGLPERVLSLEKGYAQLAVEFSELKERLSSPVPPDSSVKPKDLKILNPDVVEVTDSGLRMFLSHSTFQPKEWFEAIDSIVKEARTSYILDYWLKEGVECKALVNGQWQSGKVKLTMEFCPDEEEKAE